MSEELLAQLVKMVATCNQKLDKLSEELHDFRHETAVSFKRFERRVKAIESDLDETMVTLSEITEPKQ